MFVPRRLAALAAVPALLLGACITGPGSGAGGKLEVTGAFYPLAYAAEQIGGANVTVTSLTKPGAEPHDVELTPQQVAGVGSSGLVIYLKGMQQAVDSAVSSQQPKHLLEVSQPADLTLVLGPSGTETVTSPGTAADRDPHFWLDPTRYAAVASAIGDQLAALDPTHAADYTAGTKAFLGKLDALDGEFKAGLAHCSITTIVTGHTAFGYLADRYGLTQQGVSGLSPDNEPDAQRMAQLITDIKTSHVSTVYAETLVSPALVRTIADETGAKVAVLDPAGSVSDASPGKDYFEIMRADLATLRTGQECS